MEFHLGDLTVSSPAFEHGRRIPDRFTVGGDDVSPELVWDNVPEGTRSFALVCDDPDAPVTYGFTHWVAYDIPGNFTGIAEGGTGFTEGLNDFGNQGYGGPAPPHGHGDHHYFFHLYALSTTLSAEPGLSRAELLQRIDPHIIEQARVVGTWSR